MKKYCLKSEYKTRGLRLLSDSGMLLMCSYEIRQPGIVHG